jgi:hypothetical protein
MRRAEGDAKILGVFRVKNHDFTPKNHIFSNVRGGRAPGAPPGSAPVRYFQIKSYKVINTQIYSKHPVIHFTSSV